MPWIVKCEAAPIHMYYGPFNTLEAADRNANQQACTFQHSTYELTRPIDSTGTTRRRAGQDRRPWRRGSAPVCMQSGYMDGPRHNGGDPSGFQCELIDNHSGRHAWRDYSVEGIMDFETITWEVREYE